MKLTIGYLYGDIMNIYGDTGNITTLEMRSKWRGIEVEVVNISLDDNLPSKKADVYFFGGGQDLSQIAVSKDLFQTNKGKSLKSEVERGVPLLAICGGYQLLGDYYQPHDGERLPGIGIFPAFTIAGEKRMIGNILTKSNVILRSKTEESRSFATARDDNILVGFENHSGKTYLKDGAAPLGKVLSGFGNNGEDRTEGCIYKNAIGCYMHGSLLPKNPLLADWLLTKALEVKYDKEVVLQPLDNTLENRAHDYAISKFH